MSFTQTVPEFINQVQPAVLPVSKVKTEAPMVIKNEPPESKMVEIGVSNILDLSEEKIIPDIKDTDIVWHPLCKDSIKSETVPEDLLETKHLDSVETQVYVKTENSLIVKTENIIQSENLHKTENTSGGNENWGNGQGAVEVIGSNEEEEQLVLNFSRDLNGISTKSRKAKYPEKIDFAGCYKTDEIISWENEKIKVFRAPVNPVEPHEYTSLAEDEHVCNHCQYSSKTLKLLKTHIKRIHRKVTTMYQCSYCPYKSKWSLRYHIILKHKSAKDIQWFQCHLCEIKFKLKYQLIRHMKDVHLTPKQIQEGSELCLVCGKRCTYKKREKRYCSEKCAKKRQLNYHCDKCNYKSYNPRHLNNHKLTHLKPEEIEYLYCYHCSHKNKHKQELKRHILRHFRNENVPFHCYICDFVTQKRDLIIEHIRKHLKNRNKYDETISKYQLESRINKLGKRLPNNLEDYCSTIHFDDHVNHIKKQKSEQPESTKSFVSRTESEPENSSKSWIFQCTYCPTIFSKEHLLKGHLQLHSSTKGIECPICTYRHNKTEILKHLSWHGANGEDPFICPICNLKKHTKENMDDHLKVVHSKAIYQKHDSVCKNKTCNGFCQITIGGNVGV